MAGTTLQPPVWHAEIWLKLAEKHCSGWIFVRKNTVSAEKTSRTSRIWGKPNGPKFIYEINCYFVHVVLSDFPLFRNHIDIILTTKNRPNIHAFQISLEFIKIWQIFNHDSYPSDAWENDWDSGDGFTRAPCATVGPSPARQQAYSGSQVCMHGTRTHQFG